MGACMGTIFVRIGKSACGVSRQARVVDPSRRANRRFANRLVLSQASSSVSENLRCGVDAERGRPQRSKQNVCEQGSERDLRCGVSR